MKEIININNAVKLIAKDQPKIKVVKCIIRMIKENKIEVLSVQNRVFGHAEKFVFIEDLKKISKELESFEYKEDSKVNTKKVVTLTNLLTGEIKTFESQRAASIFLNKMPRTLLRDGQIVGKVWKVSKESANTPKEIKKENPAAFEYKEDDLITTMSFSFNDNYDEILKAWKESGYKDSFIWNGKETQVR